VGDPGIEPEKDTEDLQSRHGGSLRFLDLLSVTVCVSVSGDGAWKGMSVRKRTNPGRDLDGIEGRDGFRVVDAPPQSLAGGPLN